MAICKGIYVEEACANHGRYVLFLAPSYPYALKVIENLRRDLRDAKFPITLSTISKNMYVSTDEVYVEFTFEDPVKWTPGMFARYYTVFGKKELVEKAKKTFHRMNIQTPDISLSKFIKEVHERDVIDDVEPRTSYLPEITKVHFNDPMTIVMWADGTKTIVKCQEDDMFDEHVGLAMCIAKKAFGNTGKFNEVFKKHIPEHEPADPTAMNEFIQNLREMLIGSGKEVHVF